MSREFERKRDGAWNKSPQAARSVYQMDPPVHPRYDPRTVVQSLRVATALYARKSAESPRL